MGSAAQPKLDKVDRDLADLERVLTNQLHSLKGDWYRCRQNVEMAQEIVDYFDGQNHAEQPATVDELRRSGIDGCRDQARRHLETCQNNFLQVSFKVNNLRQTIAKVQVMRCYRIVYGRRGITKWQKANDTSG